MKLKLTAAALLAVFCVLFAAGCGEEASSSKPSDTSSVAEAQPQFAYSVSNARLRCNTNIHDYITDKTVDIDKLALALGWEKTNKTAEWTIAANGARCVLTLDEIKDGVYPGVKVTQNTMDKKDNTAALTFSPAGEKVLYTYGKGKITLEGIAVVAYAMENAATAEKADPFNIVLSRYKNDKGEYVLTDK